MLHKVALRLAGVDLRKPEDWDQFGEGTADVHLEAEGRLSLATLYGASARDAMDRAYDFAVLLRAQDGPAAVAGVHDELVSTATIADRVELGPEAVRLWVEGRRRGADFPGPWQVIGVGAKPQQMFNWREVLAWVRGSIGSDPEPGIEYLSDEDLAVLAHRLLVTVGRGRERYGHLANFSGLSWTTTLMREHLPRQSPSSTAVAVPNYRLMDNLVVHNESEMLRELLD